MERNDSFLRNFPLLSAVGIVFAILLCLLTSAMIYVTIPQTVPFFRLFFSDIVVPNVGREIISSMPSSPTPFQPLVQETSVVKATLTPTQIPTVTTTSTPSELPELYAEDEEYEIGDLPASASISGVYGSPQLYTLDCEAQAAVDWARFFGYQISKLDFIDRLPVSDDPEKGFVGHINGPMGQFPPSDYGIHAGPVADLLREFNVPAAAVRNWDLKKIKNEIASGRPVIVWIVNLPFEIETQEYTSSNGNTTTVARFEHTWIVTGYNMNVLTVIDSEWSYNVKTQTFLDRWGALGNQAIVYRGK